MNSSNKVRASYWRLQLTTDLDKSPQVVVHTGTRPPTEIPEGLELRHVPMLEVEPVEVNTERLSKLTQEPTGLVIYSRNATRCLRKTGVDEVLTPFDRHTWWAVGEKSATHLHREFGVRARYPTEQNFEGLLAEFATAELPDSVIAFSLEGKERDLGPVLNDRGITFTDVPVYRTVPAEFDGPLAEFEDADWIVLTSPRGVRVFHDLVETGEAVPDLSAVRVAAIGPTTAESLAELDIDVDFVPGEPGLDAILRAIAADDT